MTVQSLLFISADRTTLFDLNGNVVTQLANGSSNPVFAGDPLYGANGFVTSGLASYIVLPDASGNTSAIWSYNGTALTQITASTRYVYDQADPNAAPGAQPLAVFNGTLVYSSDALANQANGQAVLTIYNPTNKTITPIATASGGYNPQDFVVLNNALYYEAFDNNTQSEAIYSFNGTSITEVYNLHPTFFNSVISTTESAKGAVNGPLVAFNGNLYFGSGQETVYELNATTSLSNSATNRAGSAEYDFNSNPATGLIVANNHLFFSNINNGVYSLDTNNNLTNILGSIGAQSFTAAAFNGGVYFTAYDLNSNQTALQPNFYFSNGTGKTVLASNVNYTNFVVNGTTLYFNNGSGTTLGSINTSNVISSIAVPGGAGGAPFGAIPFAATSWTPAVSCYLRGSRIATPAGEVNVEDLRIGGQVVTVSGVIRSIRWIGRRTIDCTRYPHPEEAWPIRICRHSFGLNVPYRDLWLSPSHAVYADEMLVPAFQLVNGRSIVQEKHDSVQYFHIELGQHDVLLANGLPCESLRDIADPDEFDNADTAPAPGSLEPYARIVSQGPRLEALRERLVRLASPVIA